MTNIDNKRIGVCKSILSNKDFLLFLDLDGVVNYCQTDYDNLTIQGVDVYTEMGDQPIFPLHKVKLLNDLCSEYNIQVVISSSWRIGSDLKQLSAIFEKCGATFKIIGHTGQCCSGVRGVEIRNWIKTHINSHKVFTRYVIVDDNSDMLLWQKNNFIHVNEHTGLTLEDCNKVRKLFNKQLEVKSDER